MFSLAYTYTRARITHNAYMYSSLFNKWQQFAVWSYFLWLFRSFIFIGLFVFCYATVSSFLIVHFSLPLLHKANFSCIHTGKAVGYLWILNITVDLAMIFIYSKIPITQLCVHSQFCITIVQSLLLFRAAIAILHNNRKHIQNMWNLFPSLKPISRISFGVRHIQYLYSMKRRIRQHQTQPNFTRSDQRQ